MRGGRERIERQSQSETNSTDGSQLHLTTRHTAIKDSYEYLQIHNTLHTVKIPPNVIAHISTT